MPTNNHGTMNLIQRANDPRVVRPLVHVPVNGSLSYNQQVMSTPVGFGRGQAHR